MVNFHNYSRMTGFLDVEREMDRADGSRLDEPSVIALLSRLQVGGLVRRGCVNLISFQAMRESLGEAAWRYARGYVWTHVEHGVASYFPPGASAERLNDVEFLVVWPSDSPTAGQDASIRLLVTAFRRLRMAWRPKDLIVRCVTEVRGVQIGCVDLDAAAILRDDRPSLESC